jgi:putative membrane protein insertion efficiency factor
MKTLLILLLRGYKFFISPLLGNHCRFYPSCSEYMTTAIGRFGVFKGLRLGLKRLGRCHPGCPGGIDHVPQHWPAAKPAPCTHNKNPDNPHS